MNEKSGPVLGKTSEWASYETCSGANMGQALNPYTGTAEAGGASAQKMSWPGPTNAMFGVDGGPEIRGLLVFKVNVGQLPVEKAEALVQKFEASQNSLLDVLSLQGIDYVIIPVRNQDSDVEFIKF